MTLKRLLVRGGKTPECVLSPEATLAYMPSAVFGSNSGNLLFSHSVMRALAVPDAKVVADAFALQLSDEADLAGRVNEQFDAVILPLANAFRSDFLPQLNRLTTLIDSLTIPIVIVGVGCQIPRGVTPATAATGNSKVAAAVTAFMRAALERSTRVGVRGEITRAYLQALGFGDSAVEVIGCPSLYDKGPDLRVERRSDRLTKDSLLTFNTAFSVPGAGTFVQRVMRHYPRSEYVGQLHTELALLLWGESIPRVDRRLVSHPGHQLYREDRVRFFIDPLTWTRYFESREFSVGTRIHGTMAAVLGGAPAVIFDWDSRTTELADYHQLPHQTIRSLDEARGLAQIYEELDLGPLNRAVSENFRRYTAFLEANGLRHIWQPGRANPDYSRRIEKAPYPPAVGSIYGDSRDQILDRLRWLRQGPNTDKTRSYSAYAPTFSEKSACQLTHDHLSQITEEIASLRREVAALKADTPHSESLAKT
ncbi:MAG: polysaccharide pyruvyl transferase family protein [Propionibacteriaceae bacterium]|jgi:hypothetical protein|nr:polysaccharide pyruvyl transferase family protein [Propionibacteriaceae bacterium]